MRVRRARPKRAYLSFVSVMAMMTFMPTPIGLQDIASFIARQSFVPDNVRQRLSSPFGTIHAATFTMPRPIGTAIPQLPLYTFASVDPDDPDITGSIGGRNRFLGALETEPQRIYPTVNRASKGDRLVPSPDPVAAQPDAAPSDTDTNVPGEGSTLETEPPYDISMAHEYRQPVSHEPVIDEAPEADHGTGPAAADQPPAAQSEEPKEEAKGEEAKGEAKAEAPAAEETTTPAFSADPSVTAGRIFFDSEPLGGAPERIEPWAPGVQIVLESPDKNDPDLKKLVTAAPSGAETTGETLANKGEVTGVGKRPKSPAERLGLFGASRAKAEKCLSDAVYHESRGEPERGQIAVAQVVMNRVFSGFYPPTVCGVVYQNAHRKLACQFTFACDGIPDRITEPDAWAQAKKIARDTLDGKLWLKQVGKSTHYHAYWVRPRWVREMFKLHKLGVHTFYRPRKWGDGSDEPVWGDAAKSEGDSDKRVEVKGAAEKL